MSKRKNQTNKNDIQASLNDMKRAADVLQRNINKLPKHEGNTKEIDTLNRLLDNLKSTTDSLMPSIKVPPKSPVEQKNAVLPKLPELPKSQEIQTKAEVMEQLKDSISLLKETLNIIADLIDRLIQLTKEEILAFPKNKIQDIRNKVETAQYGRMENQVLKELDAQTQNLAYTLASIQKASDMLAKVSDRNIKPMSKGSILKQLRENQGKAKQTPVNEKKNNEISI